MSLVNLLFTNLEKDIHHHLDTIRVEMLTQLHKKDLEFSGPVPLVPKENESKYEQIQDGLLMEIQRVISGLDMLRTEVNTYVNSIEQRLEALEHSQTPLKSGGLEGILMKSCGITVPSPALSAAKPDENMVISRIQLVLDDEDQAEAEPDDEAIEGQIAEEAGGIDEEEEEAEEEEEEAEEEEEEVEELELEEFPWKGRTYYKSQHNLIYRANEDGEVEDEPFAEFDPKTNRLTRIS